jgi:RNA polymerase sigma-70 factor (ECF subfamily)
VHQIREDPDRDLVEGILKDPSGPAFEELYHSYKNKVFATAYRVTGSYDEAADIVQETFLRVYSKVGKLRFRAKFSSWLYRVCVNLALDSRRRTGLRQAHSLDETSPTGASYVNIIEDGKAPNPEQTAAAGELSETMRAVLAELSPKLRAVITLRYFVGLSYEEVSQVMDMSLGTVKSRLNRAHEQLRPLLEEVLAEQARGAALPSDRRREPSGQQAEMEE